MSTPEKLFFASPDPRFALREGTRIAPNQGNFPTDAVVKVETQSHILDFSIELRSVEPKAFVIELVKAVPPLPGVEPSDTLTVEGDILKKDQEFRLRSGQSSMAFRALRILSNVEGLVVSPRDRKVS